MRTTDTKDFPSLSRYSGIRESQGGRSSSRLYPAVRTLATSSTPARRTLPSSPVCWGWRQHVIKKKKKNTCHNRLVEHVLHPVAHTKRSCLLRKSRLFFPLLWIVSALSDQFFPRTPPSIQLRCHTVRHSLQTEKMKLAIEAQSTCFLHASDVVRNFSQSVGGKKIQCYIKPWDTISSIEITKELMIVSPTPATLSSATVAAQLSTRLLLRRTGSEGALFDFDVKYKSSVLERPSPESSQGVCALLRCLRNPENVTKLTTFKTKYLSWRKSVDQLQVKQNISVSNQCIIRALK